MKHVFVETNFLVDVLRPFPKPDAVALHARHGADVTLHVPWCSITEAKRTMERIIREDLAFVDGAGRFSGQLQAKHRATLPVDLQAVRAFINMARDARRNALFDFAAEVDALAVQLAVIPPSPAVVRRTLSIFPIKSLPPFDEMVLGAVLTHAEELLTRGERELFFCNLNVKDFEPSTGNDLARAYADVGLQYLDTFRVPR